MTAASHSGVSIAVTSGGETVAARVSVQDRWRSSILRWTPRPTVTLEGRGRGAQQCACSECLQRAAVAEEEEEEAEEVMPASGRGCHGYTSTGKTRHTRDDRGLPGVSLSPHVLLGAACSPQLAARLRPQRDSSSSHTLRSSSFPSHVLCRCYVIQRHVPN